MEIYRVALYMQDETGNTIPEAFNEYITTSADLAYDYANDLALDSGCSDQRIYGTSGEGYYGPNDAKFPMVI